MRSVLLVAFKNISKRKLQNSLIALIIGASALILSTGVGMLQSFNSPIEKVFKELNSSQTLLYMPDGLYNIQDMKNWWLKQPQISGVTVYPSYIINTKLTIKGARIDKCIRFSERENIEAVQDKLYIISGEKKNSPSSGEVWVPTGFAYAYNLKVGDTLDIPTANGSKPVKVSAIVVDPHSSSSLQGTIRMWIASGDIKQIFDSKSNNVVIGLSYKDYSTWKSLWKSFESYLKAPFGGYMMGYDEFISLYTDLYKIAASVLILFSVIVIICAVFVIAFTISNSILADYKIIGILKAQGFTSRQIQASYQIQFILITLISVPLGVLGGYFCINAIMISLLKAVGINRIASSMFLPLCITLSVILAVAVLVTYASSKKTCSIKPSDAIKAGAPDNNIKTGTHANILKLKKFPLSLSIGVKQAITYKRQSLFIIITMLLTSFVFTGTINSYNTLLNLGDNLPYWGLDNSDLTVEFPSETSSEYTSNFVAAMKKDRRVEGVLPWCWSRVSYKTEDSNSKTLEIMAYDGDLNSVGITNIKGRSPITEDEVSLAINTSKDMKKDIGDSVDIYIQGIKKSFIITGVYQSTLDGGTGLRLQMKAIANQLADYDSILYAIKLKNSTDSPTFLKELQSSYSNGINVKRTFDVYKSFIASTTDNLSYALLFLFIVFTAVTFIVVFNITLITIYQQKKELGIFKALGMTNTQIRAAIAYKTLLAAIIGILLGVPCGILFIPKLLNMVVSSIGLLSLPYVISIPGTLAILTLSAMIVSFSVWVASSKVVQIKLSSLINE